MCFPISPLIANLFREEFESRAISSTPNPFKIWLRYVADTFVLQQAEHGHQFLQHITSTDPHIQLSTENPSDDCSIPFLDTLVFLGTNNTPMTSLYRKPTHRDQYLHWHGNHISPAKYSVFNTPIHRTWVVCSSQSGIKEEQDNIKQAVLRSKCPSWALNIPHTKINYKLSSNWAHDTGSRHLTNNHNNNNNHSIFLVAPYSRGLSEILKKRYLIQ